MGTAKYTDGTNDFNQNSISFGLSFTSTDYKSYKILCIADDVDAMRICAVKNAENATH